MKTLKLFMFALVLAVASCRSVPQYVVDAHARSKIQSAAAIRTANDLLVEIETKSAALNSEHVDAQFAEYVIYAVKLADARAIVAKYLVDTKAGPDVGGAYATAAKLLSDMDDGMMTVKMHWQIMLVDVDDKPDTIAMFINKFRIAISRYATLERKFDEWISQFSVK